MRRRARRRRPGRRAPPGRRRGRAGPRPAASRSRASRPGSPTSTSTSSAPSAGHRLGDEAVDEAVLLAHAGELRVEPREVARRRLAELLHGEDVEPGQVEGLEVGQATRRAAPGRRRGGSGRGARALGLGGSRSGRSGVERLRRVHLAVGRAALLELERSARSVTSQPFTASAGQVAHQLTTPTRRPFSEATFQNAFTLRSVALGGCVRVSRRRSVAAPRADANGLALAVEAHRRAQAGDAARVGRLDAVGLGPAAGGDRRPDDGRHALRLGPQRAPGPPRRGGRRAPASRRRRPAAPPCAARARRSRGPARAGRSAPRRSRGPRRSPGLKDAAPRPRRRRRARRRPGRAGARAGARGSRAAGAGRRRPPRGRPPPRARRSGRGRGSAAGRARAPPPGRGAGRPRGASATRAPRRRPRRARPRGPRCGRGPGPAPARAAAPTRRGGRRRARRRR